MSPLFQAVLTVVIGSAPIVGVVGPFIYKLLVGLLPKNDQFFISDLVQSAVKASEQFKAGESSSNKKQFAMDSANALLSSMGVKMSPQAVDALIEAAVFELNQNGVKSAAPAAAPVVEANPSGSSPLAG
jgi:hypothetical protein